MRQFCAFLCKTYCFKFVLYLTLSNLGLKKNHSHNCCPYRCVAVLFCSLIPDPPYPFYAILWLVYPCKCIHVLRYAIHFLLHIHFYYNLQNFLILYFWLKPCLRTKKLSFSISPSDTPIKLTHSAPSLIWSRP